MIIRRLESSNKTVYGNGVYTNNIYQNGVLLTPITYTYNNTTYTNTIVITGAATITPDSTTLASCTMSTNTIILSGGSLSASTHSKALELHSNGTIINDGTIHMNSLGYAGNFGNVTPITMLPTYLLTRVNIAQLKTYIVSGEGATGALANSGTTSTAYTGAIAGAMQTGGGGSGGTYLGYCYGGGKGGPCCGGAGSGGAAQTNGGAAGDYGGPGGNGYSANSSIEGVGGAGMPVGTSNPWGTVVTGCGGGLIFIFAKTLINNGIISANGANSRSSDYGRTCNGGAAGGGCIVIVTNTGKYTNNGTVQASGGAGYQGHEYFASSYAGDGSVNVYTRD